MKLHHTIVYISLFVFNLALAATPLQPAVTKAIPIKDLATYDAYSAEVKQLIGKALALSQQNLTYLYGSSNPKNGGMDCSGTIYYLLKQENVNAVPRDSRGMYQWLQRNDKLHLVNTNDFNSTEFAKLKPGDLLFWSGTYNIKRNPPITHVMLYLGKNKQGEPLMFGASDGRTYHNKRMCGVSVFDFKLPQANSSSKFVGYGCIPGLTCKE